MRKATFGTISHATMQPRDLIPAFVSELNELAEKPFDSSEADALLICDENDWLNDEGQEAMTEIVHELADALNAYAPDYGYFGAHPGDGSDYGFWLDEEWQQNAKDDGVVFVNDLSEAPENYCGTLCVVNDHGNATLYSYDPENLVCDVIWEVV